MKRFLQLLLCALMVLSAVSVDAKPPARSTTYYVNAVTGNDANLGTKPSQALATIGAAVAMSVNGDTINVSEGLYTEQVLIAGFGSLTLQGGWDASFNTVDPGTYVTELRGNGLANTIGIDCPESYDIVIDGFTVTNFFYGIHLFFSDPAALAGTVSRCMVTNCSWGIYFGTFDVPAGPYASGIVDSCEVFGCSSGIRSSHSYDFTATNNLVWGNYQGIAVIGTYLYSYPSLIANNIVYDNTSSNIYSNRSQPKIINNTASGSDRSINITMDSLGYIGNNIVIGASGFGIYGSATSGTIRYTNLLFNNVNNYMYGSIGTDIHEDPQLDTAFHLTETSPCINAGTDYSADIEDDFDGDPRILPAGGDGIFDIGADEYFSVVCTDSDSDGWTTCDGDCNDNDPQINPGMDEKGTRKKDGKDNDCNGIIDG